MSTERMTTERWAHLSQIAGGWCTSQQAEVRDELSRSIDELISLREQLSLANDKRQEQVRAARYEVAEEGLEAPSGQEMRTYLERIRDANAPKD
jgi:VIT1/CCC1 family predicted Fe2+/Mn2+ transporter